MGKWPDRRWLPLAAVLSLYILLLPFFAITQMARSAGILTPMTPAVLSAACDGTGIYDAAAYTRDPGVHPLTMRNTEGRLHHWVARLPRLWVADSLSTLEQVVCEDAEEWVELPACAHYGGSAARRLQHRVAVRLVEARTGAVVAARTFWGARPAACTPVEYEPAAEIRGETVEPSRLVEWLRPQVEVRQEFGGGG
jgi:hypothetical protein